MSAERDTPTADPSTTAQAAQELADQVRDGPSRTDTDKAEPGKRDDTDTDTAEPTKPDDTDTDPDKAEPTKPDDTDPWSRFAPTAPVVPGRLRRGGVRVARFIGHEWTLASAGGLVLAVLMTWPTILHPTRTIPEDIWDPTLQAWQMAWSGHSVGTDPAQLWNANAFFPEHNSFAFSDTLLGYFPAGLIGTGPVAALVRYNVMFVLIFALAFVGGYALLRQLGSTKTGAALAGVAIAYAPWRWGQAGHMHVLSTGGIVLSLAMLARGHGYSLRHGRRPDLERPRWALAGWLVAAWQISLGFGIGLPYAYVLAAVFLVSGLVILAHRLPTARGAVRTRAVTAGAASTDDTTGAAPDADRADATASHPGSATASDPGSATASDPGSATASDPGSATGDAGSTGATGGAAPAGSRPDRPGPSLPRRRLLVADGVGMLVFAAVGAFMAQAYLTVAADHPYAKRSIAELAYFSPPLRGFFTAPPESLPWGGLHDAARATLPAPPEMALLPGFMLYGLALVGLFLSVWRLRVRLWLLAGVIVSVILAMGTRFYGGGRYTYLVLYHLPGLNSIRTPGRLVVWTTILLAVLAAGAISGLVSRAFDLTADRVPYRPGPLLRLVTLVPVLLVLLEGTNQMAHPVVPPQPAVMRTLSGPLLVLPSDQLTDENVMLWSTTRFQRIVNGGSGFVPRAQEQTRQVARSFPDAASVDYLRQLGVHTVVVLKRNAKGTDYEKALTDPGDGLGITRTEDTDTVVFQLNR